ncbi:MAG: hypothetical protein MK538_12025 [Planctomycetes bacterium]|nr:hypothetical protein [Planctomycetota bacterium]
MQRSFGSRLETLCLRCCVARRTAWGAAAILALVMGSTGFALAEDAGGLLSAAPGEKVATGGSPVSALVVEQLTRGLPDRRAKGRPGVSRQVMVVDSTGQRLFMRDFRQDPTGNERLERLILVRMDQSPPAIYSISPDRRHYMEHPGDLNEIQRDRRIAEINAMRLVQTKYSARERKKYLQENPQLRLDGKRIVTADFAGGEELLGRQCESVVVKENNLKVIEAQITREIPGAKSYFHLYRRLGVFSEEVLQKLEAIEGVPLKARITVLSAFSQWALEAEMRAVRTVQVPSTIFELPEGATRLEPEATAGRCPVCGTEIEDPSTASIVVTEDNRTIHFCSDRCADAADNGETGAVDRKAVPGNG